MLLFRRHISHYYCMYRPKCRYFLSSDLFGCYSRFRFLDVTSQSRNRSEHRRAAEYQHSCRVEMSIHMFYTSAQARQLMLSVGIPTRSHLVL